MSSQNKKVVNTEEQNRTVNPSDNNPRESNSSDESPRTNTSNDKPETENPDGGSEIETPHRIEGDDADSIERRIPNMND